MTTVEMLAEMVEVGDSIANGNALHRVVSVTDYKHPTIDDPMLAFVCEGDWRINLPKGQSVEVGA